ncbi:MAG: hypothetical protein JSW73_00030 [Candidatus Woesearchaeota archaeon]|nr:MAG: hypothetical protein JSW73_00030 [Candidatus Woesearchaeota archaeon]
MITFAEIINILITIFAVGFIFSGLVRRPDSLSRYFGGGFNWGDIKFSIMVTAPAIILHEFGHKLVALSLGYTAVYHAAWWWLAIGVFLRLANVGFIFLAPAFVSISGPLIPINLAVIAFAGPLVNLILFLSCHFLIKHDKFTKYTHVIHLTKQINLWLFIINMLPIPGFDGFKTYAALFSMI